MPQIAPGPHHISLFGLRGIFSVNCHRSFNLQLTSHILAKRRYGGLHLSPVPNLLDYLPPTGYVPLSSGGAGKKRMADFVQKSTTKTAARVLAAPIADVTTFAGIVQSVIDTNPFGCTSQEVGGVTFDPVSKSREAYTARILYQDDDGKTVGQVTARSGSVAGFNAGIAEIMGNAELTAAMEGDPVRDAEHERYLCALRCHDPTGEVYYVTFARDQVRISSYADDVIVGLVEAWADTVPALA